MKYNEKLAHRLREALAHLPKVEEKKMFSGVAFMVNGKMCINVSHDDLMCRFDPALLETLSDRVGFRPMMMKGRQLKGYCYVSPEGFSNKKDFDFWINTCLDFNSKAKSSKKTKKKPTAIPKKKPLRKK